MSELTDRLVVPGSGLAGLKSFWRQDLTAGFLVFLVALPLCLGVAVASGFPPMAGILTAIVGGLMVSRISGSHVTINGPAAGLIVVVLSSVQSLGEGDAVAGYRYTLAAIVVSGLLQCAMGRFKFGRMAAFFPSSVVHGMLAAIGIIIMARQIPVMVGVNVSGTSMFAVIRQLPQALAFYVPTVALVAVVAIAILAAWPSVRNSVLGRIPAPMVVIVTGVLLGQILGLGHLNPELGYETPKGLLVGPSFLVSIPDSLGASIVYPDFSKLGTVTFWGNVVAITLVGSLETLLSAAAVDKLDPAKRYSDLNRDLLAIGLGNALVGMIGGLPMIAEIVRSSANIDAGARTGWANFFHGAFLLIFVIALPHVIDLIPLASLAALLVYTGFRLASPEAFARTLDLGREQLGIFVITVVAVLATNLLAGVLIGVASKLLLHLWRGVALANLLRISYSVEHSAGSACVIRVRGSAIFSNVVALKSELAGFPNGKSVTFDLSDVYLIDHTVMEFIDQFCNDYRASGGRCEIHGLASHEAFAPHELAARIRK
jgi:MFS superfamily sulfate permease-like transporter